MATEAVPQAILEGQLDTDLINYDADITAADNEWLAADTGADPAGLADDKHDGANARFQPQPETTGDGLNEIDWEDHELPESSGPPFMPTTSAADDNSAIAPSFDMGLEEPDFALGAEPVSTAVHGQDEFVVEGKLDEGPNHDTDADQLDEGEPLVEHEITYEEDDGHGEPFEGSQTNTPDHDVFPGESDKYPAAPAETHTEVVSSQDVDEASREGVDVVDAQAEQEYEDYDDDQQDDDRNDSHAEMEVHDDSAEQSPDDTGVSATPVPDITVTYKNEEYPLIHGQDNMDTQMGFFGDASALDLTIDNLLAKLREELTDDLGPEDEVVLQVDELGLEYAESTHRDHLSGVTLRQLHEIFDQLAKNQEPDVARTLYTNLIIRPHPAKRLEMLIDEAFNGKGLDEVIYCFQPNREGQARDDDEDMYGGSDNDGAQSAEAENEGVSPDDGASYHDDDVNDNDGQPEAEYDEISVQGEPEPEPDVGEIDEDVEYYDGFADLDTAVPPQAPEFQEVAHITDDGNEELDIVEVEGANAVGSTTQNERPYDDSFDVEQNPNEDSNAADNTGFDLIEIADDNDAAADADQAESSATATLTGDRENEIDFGENNMNDGSNANANASVAAQDSLDNPSNEIDWRDFPEESENGLGDPLASSGKRPRPNEDDGEALLESQNDVKRRRSS